MPVEAAVAAVAAEAVAAAAAAAAAVAVAEAAAVVEVADPVAADPEVAVLEVADPSADRKHSEAGWTRATRHHRNPRPTSAPRARTLRQDLLPGGCSPHINACPRRRFRIPTRGLLLSARTPAASGG
jgi:hypothetical protein